MTEARRGIGHNLVTAALRDYFSNLQRIAGEIADLNDERGELFRAARADGFDPKIMRLVLQRAQQSSDALEERDQMVALYEKILSSLDGAEELPDA